MYFVITEADAIIEYIIKDSGSDKIYNPTDVREIATQRMVKGVLNDFFVQMIKLCSDKPRFEERRVKEYKNFHEILQKLGTFLNKRHTFFGKISVCDLELYEIL